MKTPSYHGLLVIDKPGGMTSRAVVDRVQGWFPRGTRIGHTGTLDPLATGVLVLCLGAATRLTEFVQDMGKTYRAGLRLGARSDTDDADGTITPTDMQHVPDDSEVTTALQGFSGEIDQVPPQFSAVKVTGRRAYDLARRGQTVNLQPRRIAIYGIDVVSYAYPYLEIEVRCGKGTYIRSLARDLGDNLGIGALIVTLRRTRVGPFAVEDAVSLDTGAAGVKLLPLAAAVVELPRVVANERGAAYLRQGRPVAADMLANVSGLGSGCKCAAFDSQGLLVAVGEWTASPPAFLPEKVFGNTW